MRIAYKIVQHFYAAPLALALVGGPATTPAHAQAPAPASAAKAAPKLIAFDMRGKRWDDVLEWLGDQTGLPVMGTVKPTGSLTYIPPRGAKYTLPQIIDILNEELMPQKFTIIQRPRSLYVIPADKDIDPAILPRITLDELDKHGDSELVQCLLHPKTLVAEDLAPKLKDMMGPFGKATAIPDANELILQDTVGSIRRINKTITDIEQSANKNTQNLAYVCKYKRASEAAEKVKELLGNPDDTLKLVQRRTGGGGPGRGGPGGGAQGQISVKVHMWHVTSDDSTNTVLVNGPADKIADARNILQSIDKGDVEIKPGQPFLKTYAIPNSQADAFAKVLTAKFKAATIAAAGHDTLIVYAGPADQIEIAKQIYGDQRVKTISLPLNSADASKMATTLIGMFGDAKDAKTTGAPYIEADTANNAITVRGTADQVQDIKDTLAALGESGKPTGSMRVITLDSGSSTTLAEELGRMMGQMRQNPVKVIIPGRPTETPKTKKGDGTLKKTALDGDDPTGQLVDPRSRMTPDRRPGRPDEAITITPLGNKLYIHSNDTQALQLVQELSRLLTTAPSGKGDFEIVHLKNGNAADVAKIIDDLFNGPKQNQQNVPPWMLARFRSMVPQDTKPEAVRVVADPASNSLLVQASPLNMLTIRRLLTEALDTADTDSNAVPQTFIIPLKYAVASEVASVLKDVYKEHMNTTPDTTNLRGRALRSALASAAANSNKTVTLTVATDDQTNSIVVNCSKTMYEDILKLTTRLDDGAKDTTRTVKIVPVHGVDPMMLQQVLDMMQGRTTSSNLASSGGLLLPSVGNLNRGFGMPNYNRGYNNQGGPPGRGGPPRQGRQQTQRGPGFFAQRVKDDPQPSLLYDPQHAESAAEESESPVEAEQVVQARQPVRPPIRPNVQPGTGPREALPAPAAGTVQIVPVPSLGSMVLSGNPQDVAAMENLIRTLERLFAASEARIQLVYLQNADATAVANQLSQLFSRVVIGPTFTSIPTQVTQNVTTPFGAQSVSTSTSGSVILQPLPRLNAIYVAAPRTRIGDIVAAIQQLDQPTRAAGQAVSFRLKHASAAKVSTLLSNFYAIRYPGPNGTIEPDQVRITYDDSTNTVFVQAAPADLANIHDLIWRLDNTVPASTANLTIVPLRNVLSDDLAATLTAAINQGVAVPTTSGVPGIVPGAAGQGLRPAGVAGQTPGLGGFGSAGVAGGAGLGTPAAGAGSKAQSLRFMSNLPGLSGVFESGHLEDIKITSDPRINALIVTAPDESMNLVLAMIQNLDVLPALRAEVNIYTFRKADATAMASVLQQLFLGTSTTPSGTTGGLPGGAGILGGTGGIRPGGAGIGGGGGGVLGGVGGARPGGIGGIGGGGIGGLGALGGAPAGLAPGIGGTTAAGQSGAQLIPPRITVDQRTNSIIVAAARHDLDLIEALVSRLEDTNVIERKNVVYKLRNAAAADVANALTSYLTNTSTIELSGVGAVPYQILSKEVVVVPEPVSNQLLISVTQRMFDPIMRIVTQLDEEPPQVVIQALLAEVDMTNTEEFGVEVGLQSPVLFNRSVIPANGFLGTGTTTFTNAAGSIAGALVPPGVTVSNVTNPAALPGFNFNTTAPLPNNPVVSPAVVGFQGLNNLGVGRASPTSGVGGFVFSASSDAFSLLVRALKTQGRIDILSRPQITTLDGQSSSILVGQDVPYITGATTNALTGVLTPIINYRQTGVVLRVTPRISPDGKVIMRVHPEVSSLSNTTISFGGGLTAQAFNDQFVDTTITAQDGETVAIGGLITKRDEKNENKVPWFGDLPGIGALFRYRTEAKSKTELLVILTPHIVRNRAEADSILAEEAARMDWVLGDVLKVHGTSGMGPVLPPPPAPTGPGGKDCAPPAGPDMSAPPMQVMPTTPGMGQPGPEITLPQPRTVPAMPGGPISSTPAAPAPTAAAAPASSNSQVNTGYGVPQEQGTEVQVWRSNNLTASTGRAGPGN